MTWDKIKIKDLEIAFFVIFKAKELYGEQAIIYDEALSKSKHFGTTWKQEMQNIGESVYLDFITGILEEEGLTPEDFNSI
jgi:hypothetical protein